MFQSNKKINNLKSNNSVMKVRNCSERKKKQIQITLDIFSKLCNNNKLQEIHRIWTTLLLIERHKIQLI